MTRICTIEGCTGRHEAKGYCPKHYFRFRKYGDAGTNEPLKPRTYCSMDGCERQCVGRGLCDKHYRRLRTNGDPAVTQFVMAKGDTPEQRFWSRVSLTANPYKCWLWQGAIAYGYGRLNWHGRSSIASRVAFEIANGRKPKNMVLHSCDTPACVNPNHLRDGTSAENTADAIARNRIARGERAGSKLTAAQVRTIRRRVNGGETLTKIAAEFGVSIGNVSMIKDGYTWKHILAGAALGREC